MELIRWDTLSDIIKATDGRDFHHIAVKAAGRAFEADVDQMQRNSPVIACVKGGSSSTGGKRRAYPLEQGRRGRGGY